MPNRMYYRLLAVDHWMVSTVLHRGSETVMGGEVGKRFLPQWSRNGTTWKTYTDLGFSKDGFESEERALAFLAGKNPEYRRSYQGIVPAMGDLPEAPPALLGENAGG